MCHLWVGQHLGALQAALLSESLRFVQQQLTAGEAVGKQFQASVLVLQGQKPRAVAILGHMKAFHAIWYAPFLPSRQSAKFDFLLNESGDEECRAERSERGADGVKVVPF